MSRGASPPPATPPPDPADATFDARFAPLREVEPPAALVTATLRVVEDARFDEGFAALVGEPPAALVAATLAAVQAEAARAAIAPAELARPGPLPSAGVGPTAAPLPQAPDGASGPSLPAGRRGLPGPLGAVPRGLWPVLAVGMLLLLMVLVPRPMEVADPAQLVPKGAGEVVPALGLRGVVSHTLSEVEERFRPDVRYLPGDLLRFRVTTPHAGTLRLLRDGELVWAGEVAAGEVDLPVGWSFTPEDRAVRYTVEMDGALPAHLDALAPLEAP